MENPASLCLTLTHTKLLPEHWQFKLLNLLKQEESDLTRYEWIRNHSRSALAGMRKRGSGWSLTVHKECRHEQ